MARIYYERICDEYRYKEAVNDSEKLLTVIIGEPMDGMIEIGGVGATVQGGVAQLDLSSIGSGEKFPMLYSGCRKIPLESFVIRNSLIYKADPDGDYVRMLARLVDSLEKKVSYLEERLDTLSEKIQKSTIL